MSIPKSIIFGPTGAVGSAAARTASQLGAPVVLAMRDTSKSIPGISPSTLASSQFQRVYADLTKPESVFNAVRTTQAARAFIYVAHGSDMRSTITALKDAGVNEADASRIRVTMDRDDGMLVYEVRFDAAEVEYDYEIDAESGRIISTDVERWDDDDRDDRNRTANANVAVSRDEAVKTALGKVSGATEKDVRIELDYDDGRYRYEGDIIYNGIEYDFEIDADSGRILEWEEDRR